MNTQLTKLTILLIITFCLPAGCGDMNPTDVTRMVLDNGMTVLVKERHSAPVVAINTWVNTGYFNEPDSLTGISHLLEHMFFKGTKKREVGQLREDTKRLGGYLNGGTIYEYTNYYTVLPSRFFREGLEIQSDALWNSTIDSVELSKETKVVVQEVKRKLDRPDALAWEKLMELAFDHHPIRRWRMGTPEQIKAWSRDQLVEYYRSSYRPDNIILAVVGDVRTEEVLEEIRKYYGGVGVARTTKSETPKEPPQAQFRYRQMKGDITTTYLKIGFHIPGQLDRDFFALEVLAHILGRGRSSRLSQVLLEKKRLVNSISSEAYVQKDFGLFMIEAELEAENLLDAELEVFREIERIKRQAVSDQELVKAKNAINFSYLSSIETARGLSANLAFFESYGDYRLGEQYVANVEKVTADEVRTVASKYLVLTNSSLLEYRPNSQFDEGMTATGMAAAIDEGLKQEGQREEAAESKPAESSEAVASTDYEGRTHKAPLVESTAQRDTLSCGATLITRENHILPLVSVGIYFKGGRIDECEENSGITQLTLEGSLKGTERRTGEEIFSSLEVLGASLEREAEADYFGYLVRLLSASLEQGLQIMADVVKNPVFDPDELEKEKAILLARIEKDKDNMGSHPIQLFYRAAFGEHPYGLNRWGTEEAVAQLGQSQLKHWHGRHFTAANMTIVVMGDFDRLRLTQTLEELFEDFAAERDQQQEMPGSAVAVQERLVAESRSKAQTAQALGFVTCPYREEDYYALKLLQAVASGTGGRFFRELREKRGLAYTVYGVNDSWDQAGVFYAYIATSPENEEAARTALLDEFYKFKTVPVDDEEIEIAKNYISGVYQIYLETNSNQARQYAKAELLGKGIEYVEQYPERIRGVMQRRVMDVAEKYFDSKNLSLGVVRGEK